MCGDPGDISNEPRDLTAIQGTRKQLKSRWSAYGDLGNSTRAAEIAGLDPGRYSTHSLRTGLATAAADAGTALPDHLTRRTRHKSAEVTSAYPAPANLWRNNVTEWVFAAKSAKSCRESRSRIASGREKGAGWGYEDREPPALTLHHCI